MKICIACLHVGQMLFAGNKYTAEKDYSAKACTAPGGVYTTEASATSGHVCTSAVVAAPGGVYTIAA